MVKKLKKKKVVKKAKTPSSLKLRRARAIKKPIRRAQGKVSKKKTAKKKIVKKSVGKKTVKRIIKKVRKISQKAKALPEISKETFDYFMAKLDAI